MAEGGSGGGGNTGLALIVGALIVVVAVIGFFVVSGHGLSSSKKVDVNIHAPSIPGTSS